MYGPAVGPIGTSRLLRHRLVRRAALVVLVVIAASVVVHHPAPVADHGDGHHHAVSELLLCLALAGAALCAGVATLRPGRAIRHDRAASDLLPALVARPTPRARARAGPPGRSRILRT